MGWPHSPYLWRENAKPAQEQYTAVAKQISEFEPLIMLTSPEVPFLPSLFPGISFICGHPDPAYSRGKDLLLLSL